MRVVVEAPSVGLGWEDGVERLAVAAIASFPGLVNVDDGSRPVDSVKGVVRFLESLGSDDDEVPSREVTLRTEDVMIGVYATSDHPAVPVWSPFRMWVDLDDRYCGARWATGRALLLNLAARVEAAYGAIIGCGRKVHDVGTDLLGRPKIGWVTYLSTGEYEGPVLDTKGVAVDRASDHVVLTVDAPWDLTNAKSLMRLREAEQTFSEALGVPKQLVRRLQSLGMAEDDGAG